MSLILSGTDGLSDVDGSAATPAIRGTDANTGIFFPAADTIAFSEGGAEAARIDSAGNFGLGVTPNVQFSGIKALQIGSTTNLYDNGASTKLYHNAYTAASGDDTYLTTGYAQGYLMPSNGQHIWYTSASGTAGNPITFTQAMTLTAAGNLGIGIANPSEKLTIETAGTSTTTSIFLGARNSGGDSVRLVTTQNSDGTVTLDSDAGGNGTAGFIFKNSGSEKVRIDSSGNLLVGTTNASAVAGIGFKFLPQATYSRTSQVGSTASNSDTTHEVYSTGASAYRFYVGYGGTVFATSTVITAISDQRLKENVRDIDTGLNSIMSLKPRRFDWKEGKGQDKKNVAGFIAQEFETIFPECVSTSKAGADGIEYKNINHETLIPTLVKAIQEQQALITQLTARITALEGA